MELCKVLWNLLWRRIAVKIVQVPMREAEAEELTLLAKTLHLSRADFIRKACRHYVEQMREADLAREYADAYRAHPEELIVASTSASLAAGILPQEDWES